VVQLSLLALAVAFATAAFAVSQAASAAEWWTPSPGSTWQWQLSTPVDQSVDAQIYDIDLFDNSASVVSSSSPNAVG